MLKKDAIVDTPVVIYTHCRKSFGFIEAPEALFLLFLSFPSSVLTGVSVSAVTPTSSLTVLPRLGVVRPGLVQHQSSSLQDADLSLDLKVWWNNIHVSTDTFIFGKSPEYSLHITVYTL